MRIYLHLPFRQTEGVITAHAGKKAPSIPSYSTINRRVSKQLDIKIIERIGKGITIVLAHVAVDIKKKKIVSLDVTSEDVYDRSRLKELVDNALEYSITQLNNCSSMFINLHDKLSGQSAKFLSKLTDRQVGFCPVLKTSDKLTASLELLVFVAITRKHKTSCLICARLLSNHVKDSFSK